MLLWYHLKYKMRKRLMGCVRFPPPILGKAVSNQNCTDLTFIISHKAQSWSQGNLVESQCLCRLDLSADLVFIPLNNINLYSLESVSKTWINIFTKNKKPKLERWHGGQEHFIFLEILFWGSTQAAAHNHLYSSSRKADTLFWPPQEPVYIWGT